MQALIDFDGWRKWEDFATANGLKDSRDPMTGPKAAASKRGRGIKVPAQSSDIATANKSTTAANPALPNASEPTKDSEGFKMIRKETAKLEDDHTMRENGLDTTFNAAAIPG